MLRSRAKYTWRVFWLNPFQTKWENPGCMTNQIGCPNVSPNGLIRLEAELPNSRVVSARPTRSHL